MRNPNSWMVGCVVFLPIEGVMQSCRVVNVRLNTVVLLIQKTQLYVTKTLKEVLEASSGK